MNPDQVVQLIDLYARAQSAIERDELDQAAALLDQAGGLLGQPADPQGDPVLLGALAGQAEAARRDAESALAAARDRLLRAAHDELRAGGEGVRAYAGTDERPAARFIDRTG
jgi:hypothetical protein